MPPEVGETSAPETKPSRRGRPRQANSSNTAKKKRFAAHGGGVLKFDGENSLRSICEIIADFGISYVEAAQRLRLNVAATKRVYTEGEKMTAANAEAVETGKPLPYDDNEFPIRFVATIGSARTEFKINRIKKLFNAEERGIAKGGVKASDRLLALAGYSTDSRNVINDNSKHVNIGSVIMGALDMEEVIKEQERLEAERKEKTAAELDDLTKKGEKPKKENQKKEVIDAEFTEVSK